MAQQEFRLLDLVASGSKVVVEAEWQGTVGVDAGPFRAGTRLRTRFAQVLELRDGRIAALCNLRLLLPLGVTGAGQQEG